jgi:hypothetical protein
MKARFKAVQELNVKKADVLQVGHHLCVVSKHKAAVCSGKMQRSSVHGYCPSFR